MAVSAKLLGTSIHEIQELWTGPDKLNQTNYAPWSLPKGLKFLCMVPLLESPKVMGLMGINDPDALHCFSGVTHCPWCGKEGQNEGTMVNHLWTVHTGWVWCAINVMIALHYNQHPLPPSPAGVSPTWGEKSWQVNFICVTTRMNGMVSGGDPNKGVKTEWPTLGCPIGNTPTHHCSPEGGQVQKVSPTNPHTPSPFLPQYLTGQPPATFEKKFKVVNKNN